MVGRQYDNFTAYYNKFYNAQQAFEDGIESVQEAERPIDRTVYLPVFPVPDPSGSASSFEEAVRKSAGVLRKHPNSRWVDDALLIIGKSYFYQGNYAGAAQKFREMLALEEGRKSEARLWLARTLVTNDQFAEAEEVLPATETTEGLNNEWTAQLLLVRGQLRVQREQWDGAADALERGLKGDVPDQPGGRASFLLGQVHETLGHVEAARAAYREVRRYDPRYELRFVARLSDVEMQGQHGDPEEALDRLSDLQRDDKNLEKRGAMARVEARILRAQNRTERARAVLRGALYTDRDEALPSTDRARVHYELATLYRDAFEDFSRAAVHFDTASTGLSSEPSEGVGAGQRLPSAPTDAQAQARQYRTLAERAQEVARLDSLLRIGRMDEAEYNAFVEKLRRRRLEATERQQERTRRLRARGKRQTKRKAAAKTGETDAGFLFYKDPARVQEGKRRFVEVWGDRPRVDNWRRRNAMQTGQPAETADTPAEQPAAPSSSASETASLDLSDIPRDSASQAEMEDRQALARYELGNSLLLAAGRPDSAATWYQRVLQESGDHPVAKRALYALAEARRVQGDTLAARSAYERLIERYPRTSFAQRARRRLGRAEVRSTTDRAAQADSLYARAYEQWQRGGHRPALEQFLSVAEQYPETRAAPRALLASAVLYWKQVQTGTVSGPRTLVDGYLAGAGVGDSTLADTSRRSGASRMEGVPASADSARRAGPQLPGPPTDSVSTTPTGTPGPVRDSSAQRLEEQESTARDSVGGRSTGRDARPDSLQSVSDSTAADTTERRVPTDHLAPLSALLRHLTEQYPDAPQVARAQSFQAMIGEQNRSSTTDSSADASSDQAPTPDSAATGPDPSPSTEDARDRVRADTLRRPTAPQRPDSTAEGADAKKRTPLPAPTSP
jgi:TolA-binding protein